MKPPKSHPQVVNLHPLGSISGYKKWNLEKCILRPVGVFRWHCLPKVARSSQPWAGGRNPVGIAPKGGSLRGRELCWDMKLRKCVRPPSALFPTANSLSWKTESCWDIPILVPPAHAGCAAGDRCAGERTRPACCFWRTEEEEGNREAGGSVRAKNIPPMRSIILCGKVAGSNKTMCGSGFCTVACGILIPRRHEGALDDSL